MEKKESSSKKPIQNSDRGTCKSCGKLFRQEYDTNLKKYSNFKFCRSCREQISKQKEKEFKEKTDSVTQTAFINYKPFPAQRKIHEAFEKKRFVVVSAGNRFGKDYCSNIIFIKYFFECVNENRHIEKPKLTPSVFGWIIAPTERMAKQNWKEIKKIVPAEWIVAISDSTFSMETIGGGVIEIKSAHDPESLVGVGLDIVEITEAARIRNLDAVWANLEARLSSPSRGRQKDRPDGDNRGCGKAIINSSPIGKNFFYTMWTWGQKDHINYSSQWESFQFSWLDNPDMKSLAQSEVQTRYGTITYAEDLERRIGTLKYQQNYLAKFISEFGQVFKDFTDKCVNYIDPKMSKEDQKILIKNWKEPKKFYSYIIGYDPATGGSGDSPIMLVREYETNNIVRIMDMMGKTYDEQWDIVAFYSKLYNNAPCAYGITGHTAMRGQLEKRGVTEIPLDEHGARKGEYVSNLQRAVENECVHILMTGDREISTLIYQMEDYSNKNGRFSNDKESHDDYVCALYFTYFDFDAVETQQVPYVSKFGTIEY